MDFIEQLERYRPDPAWTEYFKALPPDSAEKRYARWPYYLPPIGWTFDPRVERISSWRDLIPRDPSILEIVSQSTDGAPPEDHLPSFPELIDGDPSNDSNHLGHDAINIPGPSDFFATVPTSDWRDPKFMAYRLCQRYYPGDPKNPVIHPAFAYWPSVTTPDLVWDLTVPLSFPGIARSAKLVLCPEEYLTPITHPPIPHIRIFLDVLPALCFEIGYESGGIVVKDVMEKVVAVMESSVTVDEWNQMRGAERNAILKGFERRTASPAGISNLQLLDGDALDETQFLIGDVLGYRTMFWGFAMETPHEWVLYTTTKDECRKPSRPGRRR